ncbi:hypothetical protein [Parvibaculum sp.]|uniref:hypothetical protein n=1 Tax=Parvibaculum sp. TaxID=2024848 RepID=UPI0025E71AD4|nr:hypothetical protein [Parvibaculum sp.]
MRKATGIPATLGAAAIGVALTAATAGTAHAASAPTVGQLNAKAAISGLYNKTNNSDAMWGETLDGSVTAPLTHDFGFQTDALLGSRQGSNLLGVGEHIFMRDPSTGLVGLTASYLKADVNGPTGFYGVSRIGGEGELYSGPFTVAMQSGYQAGHHVDNGFYGSLTGYWYADDNLRLGLGAENDPTRDTTGLADVEYMPHLADAPGMALFANAGAGDHDYRAARIGVRFYFGADKSLKDRNREDDPVTNLPDDSLGGIPAPAPETPTPAPV